MKIANVPMDETLLIAFLKTHQLPETISRRALIQQMFTTRRENGYDFINVSWTKNQVGLELAITECGGIENLNTADVPTDETL